jgi:hypothetical protein
MTQTFLEFESLNFGIYLGFVFCDLEINRINGGKRVDRTNSGLTNQK